MSHSPPETKKRKLTIVAISAAIIFCVAAVCVQCRFTQKFDEEVLLRVHDPQSSLIAKRWVIETARDWTALGGYAVLTFVTIATILVAGRIHHGPSTRFLVLLIVGGLNASYIAKAVFNRPRPDIVDHLAKVNLASFPSSHAMMATIVYLTIGHLLASQCKEPSSRKLILATAVFLTFTIGLSRLALGVHYPMDVIAGWAGGVAWWSIFNRFDPACTVFSEKESRG